MTIHNQSIKPHSKHTAFRACFQKLFFLNTRKGKYSFEAKKYINPVIVFS